MVIEAKRRVGKKERLRYWKRKMPAIGIEHGVVRETRGDRTDEDDDGDKDEEEYKEDEGGVRSERGTGQPMDTKIMSMLEAVCVVLCVQ